MTLLSRKSLLGVSLITLAILASCTDEVDGGRDAEPGGSRLYFTVGMEGEGTQTRADGSGAATATRYLDPVEMQGKPGGKPVYLQAEETDGFPGDGQPLTRGTQVTTVSHMGAFAVSAYTSISGTPDHMYNVKVSKVSSNWEPDGEYTWPEGKKLSFYAWHPYGDTDNGLTVTDENTTGAPTLTYSVPEKVEDQQDVMTAIKFNQSDGVGGTRLQFKHALSAIRFQSGSRLSQCTLHYVKLKGVKYKGTLQLGTTDWTLENETAEYAFNLETQMDGTPDVPITSGDQTLLLMPQAFEDENAELEVSMTVGIYSYTLSAKLKDITGAWKPGKTYTYKISDNLSDIMDVDVTFFKGLGYTAHNISANGDTYTIDITYPYPNNVTAMTGRWAYETTENGVTTYEEIENGIDLNGKTTLDDLKTLCMNNTGEKDKAKKAATPIVFQVKITSRTIVKMPGDPNTPDTRQEYYPTNDNDTWYTVWRGIMYPPNYVDATNKVIMSRKDAYKAVLAVWGEQLMTFVNNYYEVDENHPTYGKGKWSLPYPIGSNENTYKADVLCDMMDNHQPPGNDELYGEKCGTSRCWTGADTSAGLNYTRWIMRATDDKISSRGNVYVTWRCHDWSWLLQHSVTYTSHANAQLQVVSHGVGGGLRCQIQY